MNPSDPASDPVSGVAIRLNGAPRTVPEGCNIADLLAELQLSGRRLAVEVNQEIVPRSEHSGTRLRAGDTVEIVQAIGGG